MANTKSAKENILISLRNQKRNAHFKSRMRTFVRKAIVSIESRAEDSEKSLRDALKIIDKTVSKGVIKKSTAARKKSRLATFFNKQFAVATTA